MKKILLLLLFLIVVVAGAGGFWVYKCDAFLKETVVNGEYIIDKGTPYSKTYQILFKDQKPPVYFNYYLTKVKRIGSKVHYGYYRADNTTLYDLLNNVLQGKQTLIKVTFPEGYNMYDVAATVENASLVGKEAMLETFTDRDYIQELTGFSYESIEGFLAPGTYFFSKYDSAKSITKTMVKEFYKTLPEDFEAKAKVQGLSFYDAVILASIVQKETYCADEAPLVAAVFLNRIKKKMRLQADPTIIYGIYNEYKGKIHKVNIKDKDNRFNTYTHNGLTPTPISNPSIIALEAVINPAKVKYYYFVATQEGKHVFAEDYNEHLKNVRIHQLGKSK